MNHLVSLSSLSLQTGIPLRKLRYCVDHELVVERNWFNPKHAVGARYFDTISAIYIVCAVKLLDAGCKREAVKQLMKMIDLLPKTGRNPLGRPQIAAAIDWGKEGAFDVADGSRFRWRVGGEDSGWMKITRRLESDVKYRPNIVITVNVSTIRELVLGERTGT